MTTFKELLEHVCKRPTMYFNGSFLVCAAFTDGMDCGRHIAEERALKGFSGWLASRYSKQHNLPSNLFWWDYIMRVYPDDETRFRELALLYAQFSRSRAGADGSA